SRELEIDELAEMVDEEVGDDLAHRLGVQAPFFDHYVAPIDDRRDRRRVRRWSANAVLLEGLDEGRLGVPRRRFREVLARIDRAHRRDIPFAKRRQRAFALLGGVVLTLGVDVAEAVEEGPRRRRAEDV